MKNKETINDLFYRNLAQTSANPIGLEVARAEGIYIFDSGGKKHIDMIAGISVNNIGHHHPTVTKAIHEQLDKYLHVMCYGEFIQEPQVMLSKLISDCLPKKLSSVYLVNSGSEAVEGALKLAKRFTGRTEMITFKNAYHGSTHGSLSVCGNEELKNSFRPLLPDVKILEFNSISELEKITDHTACVIIEPIQGEAGVQIADQIFLETLRKKCSETAALLIFDEIQSAWGRTGKMFAFEHFNVVPDIITFAKSMGGGMPVGAFVSSHEIMASLTTKPVLGHITTFGGHPLCCAAAIANIEFIRDSKIFHLVNHKELIFHEHLNHPAIKQIRSKGFMMAVEFENETICQRIIQQCIANGVITDWFLFSAKCLRIAPPLIISDDEIKLACELIIKSINEVN